MGKKFYCIFLAASIACCRLAAQQPATDYLKVGDTIPAITIHNVINDTNEQFNLDGFKDKLLILDFWATTCSACVEGLPEMIKLQQQFGERIKILPVTIEKRNEIDIFLKTNKKTRNLLIPSVTDDTILSQLFRFAKLPHEAWIYKGRVIAITTGEYVDSSTIRQVLEGKTVHVPVKDDFKKFDYSRTFISPQYPPAWIPGQPLKYVALTGYQEGAEPSFGTNEKDSLTGLYRNWFINYPVLNAYRILWDKVANARERYPNRLVLEVKDKSKYLHDRSIEYNDTWRRKNSISYEWLSPDTLKTVAEINQAIITDLDRLLGLKGRWEKRAVKTLVLIKKGVAKKNILSAGGETRFIYKDSVKKLKNMPLYNFIYYLNQFPDNPPLFDETGYTKSIDMDLEFGPWTDIKAIRKALNVYGLDFKEEIRTLNMFVLSENAKGAERMGK